MRFLNEDEERQYLAQTPPSNTLLPRNQELSQFVSTGEDTHRQATSKLSSKESWDNPSHPNEGIVSGGEWIDDPVAENGQGADRDDWMDGLIARVQQVNVQRPA